MAEIYTQKILSLKDDDYEAGDRIAHIKWKKHAGAESEMFDALILDITDDSIIVYPSSECLTDNNEVMIAVSDIID